ncbi:MAG: aminotransferase class V-fold PLP-dependent enzyme, partial [Candidatus Omnitrophica bacterium]|nr:aminotransferase class V-fold PLP-dependent enzyme [Candidatus Omnitrophota bacterium]
MTKLDAKRIRQDFPILRRTVHGKPLIYLDNAATSHKPESVVEAIADYYRRSNSNIHRGIHALSEEATAAYEGVRAQAAEFINAPGPETIVFTRNATEAVNVVAQGWGRKFVKPGDEILLTEME